MGLLQNLSFGWDSVSHVETLINEWRPRACETEKDYQNSLYNFLEEKLPGKNITKEYGIGRSKVDIAIGKKVFIELKKDIRSTGQFQRLIGQLEIYKNDCDNMLLVVCGKNDNNLMKQLRDKLKTYDSDLLGDQNCRLIEK